jgi:hypothetical protein
MSPSRRLGLWIIERNKSSTQFADSGMGWLLGADLQINFFLSMSLKGLPGAGFAKPYLAKSGFQRT